jgi:flotillin
VNITDITDESGYIESIGRKSVATALNQAKVDVANQEKSGDIGKSEAEKERRVQVATYNADAVQGENEAKAKIANVNAQLIEQEADAQRRGQIAEQNAYAEIYKATTLAELQRLEAEEIVPKEIERRKIEIAASADAAKQRIEAEGQAAAILHIKQAEAEGVRKVLAAKAEGYKLLVQACANNSQDAATMLMIEKLEEIAKLQTEAIKNLKIDKITVWDNGGTSEKGSSTAQFLSSMIKSLPPLHEIAAMSGVNLPSYLGDLEKKSDFENQI